MIEEAPEAEVRGISRSGISCRGLSAGYGSNRVLEQVDFCAQPGSITALIGPNGCGKSTLLKCLSRIIRPISGRIELMGVDMSTIPTRTVARKLALLPQGPVAPEGLTVRELVAQGRYPHQSLLRQWSRDDARLVDEAMQVTDVAQFADRAVSDLSGGQRQRCWIAMVLAQDTDIILLDEPTTFLDLKVQMDIMTLLHRISREKRRTLVIVLHELNLAATFADTVVMMRDGRILHQGRPSDVITPEGLVEVFDLEAQVLADPESYRPVCVPRVRIANTPE